MQTEPDNISVDEALRMLDLFASFGVKAVDLTFTDCNGNNDAARFRRALPIDALRRRLHAILADATRRELNVIIRPPAGPPVFLQLDDLNGEAVAAVRPVAFMTVATSPGNHQAWLAFSELIEAEFARRLRRGIGADLNASGATRLAGSLNFKSKYAPSFPRVSVVHASVGRLTTPSEVEGLNLLAPASAHRHVPSRRQCATRPRGKKAWPSYARCLEGAPMNRDGRSRDVSVCDFTWCMIAIDWGRPINATAARLMDESTKAQAEGPRYARRTAERAAQAVANNRAARDISP